MIRALLAILLLATRCAAQAPEAPEPEVLSSSAWARIDRASERGLRFLASQQQADGSFASHVHGQPGVTGLATLAFLSQGHLPGRGPYGKTIDQAIDFILQCQRGNGLITLVGPDGPVVRKPMEHEVGVAASYNHAIAGLTLSEAYGISAGGEERLKPAIEKALAATLKIQGWRKSRPVDNGGWRYLHPFNNRDSDLSVVGWHLKFLRSAKNAGFEVDDQPINDAVAYVLRCFTPEFGTFEYEVSRDDRRTRAMAGAGILALAHTSQHNRPESMAAADFILRHDFRRYNRQSRVGNYSYNSDRYHYGVFYCTLAMYQIGGRHWAQFYPPTAQTLLSNQNSDGSWQAEGAHDGHYGRAYTTSLVVLALSAPNQLLPIYQR